MNMLRHYEPWSLLDQFRRNIEQALGRTGPLASGDSTIATSAWVPRRITVQAES